MGVFVSAELTMHISWQSYITRRLHTRTRTRTHEHCSGGWAAAEPRRAGSSAVIPQCRAHGASLERDDDGGGRCTRSDHTAGKRCQSFNGEITVVVVRSQRAGGTQTRSQTPGAEFGGRRRTRSVVSPRFSLLRGCPVFRSPERRCVCERCVAPCLPAPACLADLHPSQIKYLEFSNTPHV